MVITNQESNVLNFVIADYNFALRQFRQTGQFGVDGVC